MSDVCENCPYQQICVENDVTPDECGDLDFNDPDFLDVRAEKIWGSNWVEMSYNRFTEGELDYGDIVEDDEI